MSPLPPAFPVDDLRMHAAVDSALHRIGARASAHSPAFRALGDALVDASTGGKRFRPALVIAGALALDAADDDALYEVAAAFELLHAAFVVHDDLIDRDLVRRGRPNVAGRMRVFARDAGADPLAVAHIGDAAAVLAGDLLLHEAQRLLALAPVAEDTRRRLLDIFDDAVQVSAAGEFADAVNALVGTELPADSVLAVTHDKTAVYSFVAPLRAGATLAGATAETDALIADVGSRIGLAFQLVDDLIGAFGSDGQAGRESGADLREAKQTALVAYARSSPSWERVKLAIAEAATGPIAIARAQRELDASGARTDVESLIRTTLTGARDAVRRIDGVSTRLVGLVDDLTRDIERRIP